MDNMDRILIGCIIILVVFDAGALFYVSERNRELNQSINYEPVCIIRNFIVPANMTAQVFFGRIYRLLPNDSISPSDMGYYLELRNGSRFRIASETTCGYFGFHGPAEYAPYMDAMVCGVLVRPPLMPEIYDWNNHTLVPIDGDLYWHFIGNVTGRNLPPNMNVTISC